MDLTQSKNNSKPKMATKMATRKQLSGYEFKTRQRVRLNAPGAVYDGKEGTVMFQINEALVVVKFDDPDFNRSGLSATKWHTSCLEKIN